MNTSPIRLAANADPMLLSYAIVPTPNPIQTSSANAAATAVITISVTPGGNEPVYCDTISIYLLVGPDQAALSATSPTVGVNTANWSRSSAELKTAAELGRPGDGADQYATFIFNCVSPGDYQIDYPLIFTLTAAPNEAAGTFILSIEENSATSSGPNGFSTRDCDFELVKAPFVFFLDSFCAAAVGTPLIPATEFANGAASEIQLSWASNGSSYMLYEANNPDAIPIPDGQTSYTLQTGPSVDTTYILEAELVSDSDDPEGASSQYLYQALTLTVSNPDLTPKSVTASGAVSGATLTATGAASVATIVITGTPGQTSLIASCGADIVGGLSTDTATVTELLTASGGATVTGGLSTDTAKLTGALTALGGAAITGGLSTDTAGVTGMLTASGGATVTGGLSANSSVSLCNASDYTSGTVGIGGTRWANWMLTVTNTANSGGGVSINSMGGAMALSVAGTCQNTNGSWYQPSDMRLKENIQPFRDGLAQVLMFDPIQYNFKQETGLGNTYDHVGVSAQKVQTIAPYMVTTSRIQPDRDEEYLCIDNGPLTYMLINAVKELHAIIEAMKSDVATLGGGRNH